MIIPQGAYIEQTHKTFFKKSTNIHTHTSTTWSLSILAFAAGFSLAVLLLPRSILNCTWTQVSFCQSPEKVILEILPKTSELADTQHGLCCRKTDIYCQLAKVMRGRRDLMFMHQGLFLCAQRSHSEVSLLVPKCLKSHKKLRFFSNVIFSFNNEQETWSFSTTQSFDK